MKVLALDVATQCGIAVGSSKGDPKCWSVDLGASVPELKIYKPGKTPSEINDLRSDHKKKADAMRFCAALRMTAGLISIHKPDLLVVEAFIGGQNASAYLIGLVACVQGCAEDRAVRCELVYPATVRKHFLGKNPTSADFPALTQVQRKIAIKEKVAAQCRMLGWVVPDLDAADAAATWDWACANFAPAYQAKPTGGLFNEQT